MDKLIKPVSSLKGTIEVPGDKSISHRALIFGAMCDGDISIRNLSTAADCISTANCLRALGIEIIHKSDKETIVKGKGLRGFREPENILDAGNSGTTMRLLSGLLAGQPFYSILTGDDSLRDRPMGRIIDPLRLMGANINARENDRLPPITIIGGKLNNISYRMPIASAQVKSAIMIGGLYCEGETVIIEKFQSRDHTERMLKYLGRDISISDGRIILPGGALNANDIIVPGDISSAVFFIVAALLTGKSEIEIQNVGLNETRTGFLHALEKMGADIKIESAGVNNEEPFGNIPVKSTNLKSIEVSAENIPSMVDEIPLLALAATQAQGTTIITGAQELRFKESDRLSGIASQLNRLGAKVIEQPDGLIIEGPTPLVGNTVDSFGDHRLAMALSIAGLIAEGETIINNAESVSISFPEFFKKLNQLHN